ncbi:MAG TPA: histidine kinase [Feifaniaceae bacterium]|nr:histidine kinase [Feifaniaceae bacterium]
MAMRLAASRFKKDRNRFLFQKNFIAFALIQSLMVFGVIAWLVTAGEGFRWTGRIGAFVCFLLVYVTCWGLFAAYMKAPLSMLEELFGEDREIELHKAAEGKLAFKSELEDMLSKKLKPIENEHKMLMLKKQAEYISLQSQINPHFLYNALDSVRGQVMAEHLYETADMLEALSNLFRYNISSKSSIISLEEELENVEDYIRIMNYRFFNRFKLVKVIDENDDGIMGFMLPKLTFQPIVENAILHGLEKKAGPGTITIRVFLSDHHLYITVEDDGVGMDADTLAKVCEQLEQGAANFDYEDKRHTGIALLNVAARLELLYDVKNCICVNSVKDGGTEVHIMLPLETKLNDEI